MAFSRRCQYICTYMPNAMGIETFLWHGGHIPARYYLGWNNECHKSVIQVTANCYNLRTEGEKRGQINNRKIGTVEERHIFYACVPSPALAHIDRHSKVAR